MRVYEQLCLLPACLLLACGGEGDDPNRPEQVVAEVDPAIATVVHVTWTTERPTRGAVEYRTQLDDAATPTEPRAVTEHSRTLLGLPEDTEVQFRIVTGHDAGASQQHSVRTGHLPSGMPRLSVDGSGPEAWIVVPILGATTAVTVIDAHGNIVWYHQDDRALDFYRARLSVDGKSLLYNAASVSGETSDASELVRVELDGSGSSSIPVPLLAHDFVEHPDGTLAALVAEYRDFEGSELRGDSIVEIDESGAMRKVWSAWDCFDPAEVLGEDPEHGWTFANALDYDPTAEAYTVGLRNFSSIVRVSRSSGECEWVLGQFGSSMTFTEGSARFLHQHQFQLQGDRLLVLDNDGNPGNVSRVIEYALDFDRDEAREIWRYTAEPPVYSFVLGEPERLEGGNTFVNWSAAGQMDLVDDSGAAIWKLNTNLGYVFGFHTLAKGLYGED